MKKVLLTLILMILGMAFAQSSLTFAFDDQDFAYSGSEEGYLSLTLEGGELVVHLSDEPTGTMLRLDEITASEDMDVDGDGQVTYDEAVSRSGPQKRLTLAKLAHCDVSRTRAEIAHENARLSSVVEAYSAALAALEFQPETNVVRGTAGDYTFARGDQRMGVSFSHGIDDGHSVVKVMLTAL
ncbi:MAG: Chaperone protein DnaK [uncultured Chloroflexia bacterium]|uniref:Chaperone protein DnaK n=1 Tax=uncultured Chloroflexia bacterium TaxID=1672391 RepID=A0A6J4MZ09_9CHLR|nr:MAG: Chaperone protein DnaK [uncultured Chloroflexia bacterium]